MEDGRGGWGVWDGDFVVGGWLGLGGDLEARDRLGLRGGGWTVWVGCVYPQPIYVVSIYNRSRTGSRAGSRTPVTARADPIHAMRF